MIRKIRYNIKNCRGVSLAELMVASGVLATVVYIFMGSSSFLNEVGKESMTKINVERVAHDLYESMQQNIAQYQVSYESDSFFTVVTKNELLKILPLAWNERVLTDVENCQSCKGRMGYVVTPLVGYKGLYKLTVRVTHKDDKVIKNFEDYTYLISGN